MNGGPGAELVPRAHHVGRYREEHTLTTRPDPEGDKRRALAAAGRSARKAREAIATRDGMIRLASAAGASLREIGEVVDMSHTNVNRIVTREDST